jgi:hypothetical protein
MAKLNPYTVVSIIPSNGQIVSDFVKATSGLKAFAKVVSKRGTSIEFVCSFDGHISEGKGIAFPGDSVVDGETVESQPKVFGKVSYNG